MQPQAHNPTILENKVRNQRVKTQTDGRLSHGAIVPCRYATTTDGGNQSHQNVVTETTIILCRDRKLVKRTLQNLLPIHFFYCYICNCNSILEIISKIFKKLYKYPRNSIHYPRENKMEMPYIPKRETKNKFMKKKRRDKPISPKQLKITRTTKLLSKKLSVNGKMENGEEILLPESDVVGWQQCGWWSEQLYRRHPKWELSWSSGSSPGV